VILVDDETTKKNLTKVFQKRTRGQDFSTSFKVRKILVLALLLCNNPLTIHADVLHVIGRLKMPIGASCFQNVCNKCCHLPFLTNKIFVYCCYVYKCSVAIQNEVIITCKIIYELEEKYDCILNGPWIEFVFGNHLGIF
jgi:hypothetical protein